MISGFVDRTTSNEYPDEFRELSVRHGTFRTQCAHILPPSMCHAISGANVDGPKRRMGGVSVAYELNGADIHRLENVMTLAIHVHDAFDQLELWLEATNVANQYTVRANNPGTLTTLPETVTFHAQGNLPLPDPRYLALHAACAKVAHLSGAGEYIDTIDRDLDTALVLAHDGSSARLLGEALSRIGTTSLLQQSTENQ